MKVRVIVKLRDGVLDPQGLAVKNALHHLGYEEVKDVKVGKVVFLDVADDDKDKVEKRVAELSDQLLANPIIENFEIEFTD